MRRIQVSGTSRLTATSFRHRFVYRVHGVALRCPQPCGTSLCIPYAIRGSNLSNTNPGRKWMATEIVNGNLPTFANEIFWGLWLIPFGILVYKSRFPPRILGLWLILSGLPYLATSLTGFLWPQYADRVWNTLFPIAFGEGAIMLWLLIKGAKPQLLGTAASSSGAG